jgi:prepilin-type N-terminal cleavage/methylation domain-containing protein
MMTMKHSKGFTVIELIVAIVIVGVTATLLLIQKNNFDAAKRDAERKIAINAMYYNLEEVFFEKNGYYPSTIDSKTLRAMDPALFTDPEGVKLGEQDSDYRYEPTGCDNTKCTGYSLRSTMEKEADYVKTNR